MDGMVMKLLECRLLGKVDILVWSMQRNLP
jgi:hypothetical protein